MYTGESVGESTIKPLNRTEGTVKSQNPFAAPANICKRYAVVPGGGNTGFPPTVTGNLRALGRHDEEIQTWRPDDLRFPRCFFAEWANE